jgi:site-specific DNA-adenine methylase
VPKNFSNVESLFLCGGSIELALCKSGFNVRAYTHNKELFTFWACLATDPLRLAMIIKEIRPFFMEDMAFYQFQETRNDSTDPFVRSAIFYALNRTSTGGVVSSGAYDEGCPKFSDLSISNIATFNFNNLIVNHVDECVDVVDQHSNKFLICCPYEKFTERVQTINPLPMELRRIKHLDLRKKLLDRDNWILVYEVNHDVMDAFSGFNYELYDYAFKKTNDFDQSGHVLIFSNNL